MFRLNLNYIKNILENNIDNFYCYFDTDLISSNNFGIILEELVEVFYGFFITWNIQKLYFNIKNIISVYSWSNSYTYFIVFLFLDFYAFISFFLIYHTRLALKVFDDYVNDYYRRKVLKFLMAYFLFFILLIILFFFII